MVQKKSWSQDALSAYVCLKVGSRLKVLQYATMIINDQFSELDPLSSEYEEVVSEYIDNYALTTGRRIELQALQKLCDLNELVCMVVSSGASQEPLTRLVPFKEAYDNILQLRKMDLVDVIWYPAFFNNVEEAEQYTQKAVDDYWKRQQILEKVFSTGQHVKQAI